MASLEMWHRYGLVNVMAGGISIVSNLSAIVNDLKTLPEVAMHGLRNCISSRKSSCAFPAACTLVLE